MHGWWMSMQGNPQLSLKDLSNQARFPRTEIKQMPLTFNKKEKNQGNYRLVNLTWFPWKGTEQKIQQNLCRYIEDMRLFGSGHYGFVKGKSCLINFIAFYSDLTGEDGMDEYRSNHLWIFNCIMWVVESFIEIAKMKYISHIFMCTQCFSLAQLQYFSMSQIIQGQSYCVLPISPTKNKGKNLHQFH